VTTFNFNKSVKSQLQSREEGLMEGQTINLLCHIDNSYRLSPGTSLFDRVA
jgi:hypothetical protein